jgi:3-hydroxyacyl-CoA dehydrogenase
VDLTTGLTRTAVRKILDRAGIQVPDKVDAIEVFVKEFGGESLIDVKNVAEEMIELERMGKSTKSMDEILEQSGLFDITRNPNARKGMSDEQLEQIKKEVDQDKMIKILIQQIENQIQWVDFKELDLRMDLKILKRKKEL